MELETEMESYQQDCFICGVRDSGIALTRCSITVSSDVLCETPGAPNRATPFFLVGAISIMCKSADSEIIRIPLVERLEGTSYFVMSSTKKCWREEWLVVYCVHGTSCCRSSSSDETSRAVSDAPLSGLA